VEPLFRGSHHFLRRDGHDHRELGWTGNGYTPGHPIRYKLWNSNAGEESDAPQALYYNTQPQWSTSGMYEPLATAVVELTGRNRGGYWQHHGRIS